jgi:methylenetetrahydrofolate--tRNA-(uracil-5-)-methyltransferase
MKPTIRIIGGGLAGTEAAWQALKLGCRVILHEMRPTKMTEAHTSGNLAELVCSNSLKSMLENSAPGQLKYEMNQLDSLIMKAAELAKVPAGNALAVDREVFSGTIEKMLSQHSDFSRVDGEITEIPTDQELQSKNEYIIIASGPLTSEALAAELDRLTGNKKRLFFYDAIAPVIAADSIDMEVCYLANRYGEGEGDYINVPLNKEQYYSFVDQVAQAEKMPLHEFENVDYFESCLPIEVMIERGRDTLRFGPMKPMGLDDPKTGRRPWGVIQLRQENIEKTMYSMVGFQTKMKWPEQQRLFSTLPGLSQIEILRYGSIHRNTYVEGPKTLSRDLSLKDHPRIFLAGQITGVEGYTESAAMGLLAGRFAARKALGSPAIQLSPLCVLGALYHYVTMGNLGKYAPMNANLGLLPPVESATRLIKADRKMLQVNRAKVEFAKFLDLQ